MAFFRDVVIAAFQDDRTGVEDMVAAFLNLSAQVDKAALVRTRHCPGRRLPLRRCAAACPLLSTS